MVEFGRLLNAEENAALSEDGKLYLSLIVENGQKLQKMLASLLDYSRLNTMAKSASNVDLNVILEHCELVLEEKIKETAAKIVISPLPTVKMDAEQAMQLFLFLIDNALKFQIPGNRPLIKISATQESDAWLFKIQDNGIGMEPSAVEQIFKPFQQLHGEEFPGVGMGLSLAKKIVERHQGSIGVEATNQTGSTFFFTLPLTGKSHG